MDNDVTVYLFRTVRTKPTGLRLRMKVSIVNGGLRVFGEEDVPAAGLLGFGVFLARNAAAVRQPVLFAVVNRPEMSYDEGDPLYGVVWSARAVASGSQEGDSPESEPRIGHGVNKECYLSKRDLHVSQSNVVQVKHKISIARNGIFKDLPQSDELDTVLNQQLAKHSSSYLEKSFLAQTSPGLLHVPFEHGIQAHSEALDDHLACKMYPITPTQLLVAFMQSILNIHSEAAAIAEADSGIVPEEEAPQATHTKEYPELDIYFPLESFGFIIEWHLSTLLYLKRQLPPRSVHDDQIFQGAVTSTQSELKSLANAILELLLQPFGDMLDNLPPDSTASLWDWQYSLTSGAITNMQKVALFGSTKFEIISEAELESMLFSDSKLSEWKFLPVHCFAGLLKFSKIRANFFTRLTSLIVPYGVPSKSVLGSVNYLWKEDEHKVETGSPQWFAQHFITRRSSQISSHILGTIPNFKPCKVLSSRGTSQTTFDPRLEDESRLVAVFTHQERKVCLLSEKVVSDKPAQPADAWEKPVDTRQVVRVFQGEEEIASFHLIFSDGSASKENTSARMQHYTGRYFIDLQKSETPQFTLLDLDPCFRHPPLAPISSIGTFNIDQSNYGETKLVLSVTGMFVSCLVKVKQPVAYGKGLTSLHLFYLEDCPGLPHSSTIACHAEFDILYKQTTDRNYFERTFAEAEICWLANLKQFFYIDWTWRYKEQLMNVDTILIAAFEVSKERDAISSFCYTSYNATDLVEESLLSNAKPRFSCLHTRVREYMVFDLVRPLSQKSEGPASCQAIQARMLFTTYKKQIQRVWVNRHVCTAFPQHIGHQMGYPGYETSHVSLFHCRRVFGADNVTVVLRRIDYRPV